MLLTIQNTLKPDLDQVHTQMNLATKSHIPLVSAIQQYAINQPGRKLIRPTILLLLAHALQYSGKKHIQLATIIELIHSATLLHDDVIDHANTRRNRLTTHNVYGGTQSILMGDFIYASAFELIAQLSDPTITHILAKATKDIVQGEVLQLSLQKNIHTSLADYTNIIRTKTALLFSTGAECISHICHTPQYQQACVDYTHHFGMLYQMTDDILDIDIDNTQLNKSHGTDLKEGKMTLPTILAYQAANTTDKQLIEDIILLQRPWQDIIPVLKRNNAFEQCQPFLDKHLQSAQQALQTLPPSPAQQQLGQLLAHIPKRKR